jgi:hypothetical protein
MSMVRMAVIALALACGLAADARAQEINSGQLRVTRAARGKIDLDSGQASFKIRGWEILLADDTDGIDPATEPLTLGLSEERFLIPAGALRVSKNGRKYTYRTKTDRGIQQLTLVMTKAGPIRVTMKVAGVDLSSLLIADPPLCLPVAVIIGNDDGFSGVSFDRPNPFPSKLLTIPGFCTNVAEWPWA